MYICICIGDELHQLCIFNYKRKKMQMQPGESINNKQTYTLQVSPLNKLYNTYIFKQIEAERECEIISLPARERYFLAIYDIYIYIYMIRN